MAVFYCSIAAPLKNANNLGQFHLFPIKKYLFLLQFLFVVYLPFWLNTLEGIQFLPSIEHAWLLNCKVIRQETLVEDIFHAWDGLQRWSMKNGWKEILILMQSILKSQFQGWLVSNSIWQPYYSKSVSD